MIACLRSQVLFNHALDICPFPSHDAIPIGTSRAIKNAPRGTVDLLPAESWKWQTVERVANETARLYHFGEVRTPIFEHTELFHRGVGEASDIVNKEMYTFQDRGERSSPSAPKANRRRRSRHDRRRRLNDQGARAKVYYIGPNFRFDAHRPADSQHHQFGARHLARPIRIRTWSASSSRWTSIADAALRISNCKSTASAIGKARSVIAMPSRVLNPKSAEMSEDPLAA